MWTAGMKFVNTNNNLKAKILEVDDSVHHECILEYEETDAKTNGSRTRQGFASFKELDTLLEEGAIVITNDDLYHSRNDDDNVQEFHKNRTMFVALGDVTHGHYTLAICNDGCTHEEWFKREFPYWQDIMNNCLRGYIDDTGVYMYRGYDFHYKPEDCKMATRITREVMEHTNTYGLRHVCLGLKVDPSVTKYEPLCKLVMITREADKDV